MILGVLLMIAGSGSFGENRGPKYTVIVSASLAILANLSWDQVQPTQGLIGAGLAGLVVYGPAAHGDKAAA